MELCLRVANARDGEVQSLAKVDPSDRSHYKYPALVGNIHLFQSCIPQTHHSETCIHFVGRETQHFLSAKMCGLSDFVKDSFCCLCRPLWPMEGVRPLWPMEGVRPIIWHHYRLSPILLLVLLPLLIRWTLPLWRGPIRGEKETTPQPWCSRQIQIILELEKVLRL